MSQALHTLSRPAAQPSWTQRLGRRLLRLWLSLCTQAERPTRRVPYY